MSYPTHCPDCNTMLQQYPAANAPGKTFYDCPNCRKKRQDDLMRSFMHGSPPSVVTPFALHHRGPCTLCVDAGSDFDYCRACGFTIMKFAPVVPNSPLSTPPAEGTQRFFGEHPTIVEKYDKALADLAAAREKCLKLEGAMTLADKIICTCGYAGRPELRNGIRAAHTVMSVALGKELPLHMIEEAELVKKDVLDDWPGNTKESP